MPAPTTELAIIHPPADHEERPHAERSASQLPSIAICAGYKPQPKKAGEAHWVTQQGIRGHKALERGDNDELHSEHEEKLVQMVRDYEATLPSAVREQTETRIETIEGRWGYADKLRFRRRGDPRFQEIDLIDYKFVKVKEVKDAEFNLQGKDYVIGIFDKYADADKVHVHFPMPRFGTVTTATFTRDQLPRLKLEVLSLLAAARRTDQRRVPASLLNPTYDICRFCGRLATCSAVRKIYVEATSKYSAEPLPAVPANVHASEAKDPKVLGALKTLAVVGESWAKAVTHHVTNAALDDGAVAEGYEVAFRKGTRRVLNAYAVFEVARKHGLELSDFVECSDISIKQLEDLVMAKAKRGKKKDAKALFLDALRDAGAIDRREDSPFLQRRQQNQ